MKNQHLLFLNIKSSGTIINKYSIILKILKKLYLI